MVAEAWIVKMGNQVSSNLKHALLLETLTKRKQNHKRSDSKEIIGIISFEVANVMSKTVHLHKSLSESEISKLRNEILNSEGVKNLVSSDEAYLLELALAEKLEELNRIASVVSRLGKKCSEPALQGFEHVYGDIVGGVIDVKELGFLVKHMEGMVRKMDRYVNATRNLYSEMEVLNELEQAVKKFQHNQHEESRRSFEQKLIWQKQDVRHLKEISLWNQNFDKVVELLARTVCTIYARIPVIFGESALTKNSLGLDGGLPAMQNECGLLSGHINVQLSSERLKRNQSKKSGFHSDSVGRMAVVERRGTTSKPQIDMSRGELASLRPKDFGFPCGTSPGRLFMECLSLSSSVSNFDAAADDYVINREEQYSHHIPSSCCSAGIGNNSMKREHLCHSGVLSHAQSGVPFTGDLRQAKSGVQICSTFGPKSRLAVYAPSSTLGGSALALHYANVIVVIEKLLRYPHLVGEEARDDLYQMLPTSLRLSLKAKLKSYVKNLAIYDAPLAHDWKENLDGILRWLAPLAHNMIRWHSERNFEQHQIVSRTNVLLLQTLYFSDREKTEESICELLVGLNYICRYEHQQNALLDCASSFDLEDCMEWQLQCGASFLN
ncbi:protein PSK SIMULATOR 1-like [Gastrolobium bilobum]|uniref:protein PSK SIMULATOR 1-like n=1 Tax=Gastrolobium bilobum TaxID=150636 RepID=UPI002AAF7782|nr:protein PSK SIMULATOR 1-like [Gastrolobium bilobum]